MPLAELNNEFGEARAITKRISVRWIVYSFVEWISINGWVVPSQG